MPGKAAKSSSNKKRTPVVKEDFQDKPNNIVNDIPTEIPKPPAENIFDLTKLVEIQHEEQVKKDALLVSPEDQARMLTGYDEVPRSEWDTIPKDFHVRYLRKDGNFRRGGYVRNTWISASGKRKGSTCIQLAGSSNFKATSWVVCFDDIDKLWKKNANAQPQQVANAVPAQAMADVSGIKTNTESIEYLTKSIDQIKINMTRLQNEQTRIVNLIKKLHHIKSQPTAPRRPN